MNELTTDDLAALKQADDVIFHGNQKHGNRMRAVLRDRQYGDDDPRIFTAREQRLFPLADSGEYVNERIREIDLGDTGLNVRQAFAMVSSYKIGWVSILKTLRKGDEITLGWRDDHGTNGYLHDAGLHADELHLVVWRKGKLQYEFTVETSVTANNTARMVQPIRQRELHLGASS